MSAFLVNPEHIHVLIWAAVHARPTEYEIITATQDEPTPYNGVEVYWPGQNIRRLRRGRTETVYGQLLVDQNAASVNVRYQEENAYVYFYQRPRHTQWTAVELLSALNCYEYQACETDDWERTEAKQFCDRLRRRIESWLPGADEGPWEITPDTLPRSVEMRDAFDG